MIDTSGLGQNSNLYQEFQKVPPFDGIKEENGKISGFSQCAALFLNLQLKVEFDSR